MKPVESGKIRGVIGQDSYMMGYVSLILLHAARHAARMPVKSDGAWRVTALADFLDGHSEIHPQRDGGGCFAPATGPRNAPGIRYNRGAVAGES